jgi:nitroreductase
MAFMTPYWISRRAVIGAAVTVAASRRGVDRVAAQTTGEVLSGLPDRGGIGPWDYWRSNEGAGTVRIASAAILAASPYDTQPWLFRLRANRIEVVADAARNLAGLDPYHREFYMGLGCAIENACVAAPSQGLDANVTLLPNGPGADPAAILAFEPMAVAPHPYHEAIALRHTHRGPYQRDRQVEEAVLNALMGQATAPDVKLLLIDAHGNEGRIFSDLMIEATQRILDVASLREGRHAGVKAAAPDGADISEAALRKADSNWLEATRTVACATASIFGLIMVRGSRADHRLHMEAGRLWQRLHLEGTTRGLAMQPMNHHIEVIDFEASTDGTSSMAARMDLGADWKGWEPIFGFRAGYAAGPAPASARRPLSAVVIA